MGTFLHTSIHNNLILITVCTDCREKDFTEKYFQETDLQEDDFWV